MGEYTHTHTCGWQSANGLDLKLTTAADGHCLFVFVCVVQEADGWSPVWILLVIVAVVVVVVFVRRWPVVKAYGTKGGHGNSCR